MHAMTVFWTYLLNTWLDPLSTLLGVATIVPVLLTWYEVKFGSRKRYQIWRREVMDSPGARPAVVIIDLKPNVDIRTQVQQTIAADATLKVIPKGRIFHIDRSTMLTPDDLPELVTDIRAVIGEAMRAGVDTIYLFYAGPVTPMAIVGAELANCCRVLLFQHHQGQYTNWGPLKNG